jgi:2-dehydro-3-deoxy-D-arabinonate dehydratase
MRLGQVKWHGGVTAAIFEGDTARPIPDYRLTELIVRSEKEGEPLAALAAGLASRHPVPAEPIIPLHPREVWACGSTYETAAAMRDAGQKTGDFHAKAHRAERPEIVFKGTARICVGPGQHIGIRPDSKFTAPSPELALILGTKGRIVGYTLANDVTARDLEYENPLYLSQAKTYTGSCALGPFVVTTDQIADPHELEMTCTIYRDGKEIYSSHVNTHEIARTFETMVEFLMRANPVPAGSVLLTGSGIIPGEEVALVEGDLVTIRVPELGVLKNTATLLI